MIIYLGLVSLGCLLLYLGGNFLLDGAVAFGRRLGWPPAIIGLVLVSLGTSAPELFVSAGASVQGFGQLAAGNVVGSNIINISIVLGLGALMMRLPVDTSLRHQQIPVMVLLTLISVFMLYDGQFTRIEGALLLLGTALGFGWTLLKGRTDAEPDTDQEPHMRASKTALLILGGIVLLVAGAEALILGGVELATRIGLSQAVVGLTVTAIGTSLPEIAATLVAVYHRQADLAVGNVVGSNVLNLGLVLGFAGLVAPLQTSDLGLASLAVLVLATAFVGLAAWRPGYFSRTMGFLLLLFYAAYTTYLVIG